MPHTKSAKKRLRQSITRNENNRSVKRVIKKQIRKVLDSLESGTIDQAKGEFLKASKLLDRAGAKRQLHPNTTSRRKSRLARLIQAKAAKPQTSPTQP